MKRASAKKPMNKKIVKKKVGGMGTKSYARAGKMMGTKSYAKAGKMMGTKSYAKAGKMMGTKSYAKAGKMIKAKDSAFIARRKALSGAPGNMTLNKLRTVASKMGFTLTKNKKGS